MPVQPRKILWPTDISGASLNGAAYAEMLRKMFNAELHVIHVILPPISASMEVVIPGEVPIALNEPAMIDAGKAAVSRLVEKHFENPAGVVKAVFLGNPWSAICEYAEKRDIDLIVISTHGLTGIKHALLGSTAERIVQHANCPVLVVKSKGA